MKGPVMLLWNKYLNTDPLLVVKIKYKQNVEKVVEGIKKFVKKFFGKCSDRMSEEKNILIGRNAGNIIKENTV